MTVLCLVERDGDGAAEASLRRWRSARRWPLPARTARPRWWPGTLGRAARTLAAARLTDACAVESDRLDGYAPLARARALMSWSLAAVTAVVAAGTDRGNEVMAHLGAITGLTLTAN